MNTVRRLVAWTIRERDIVKNKLEAQYIFKVLESFSLENIFVASQLEDHGSMSEDYRHLLEGHLKSISMSKLGVKYEALTPFQVLVGKRNPTPEENKRAIIIRIKKHLSN